MNDASRRPSRTDVSPPRDPGREDGRAATGPPSVSTSPGPGESRRRERVWGVAAMAGWRAAAYRFLGAVLLHPDERRCRWLEVAAQELRPYDEALAGFAFFGLWDRLLRVVEDLGERDLVALQAEHVRLFSVDPSGTPCFPFESCHVAPGGPDMGWLAVQLERTYVRAGLRLAPSLAEPPDHAAVELEFMAYLCGQEAGAWERAAKDEAVEALVQQRAFLALHLGRWLGEFARQVRVATDEPLYGAAADAADAFVYHDREVVTALLAGIERSRGAADISARAGGVPPEQP